MVPVFEQPAWLFLLLPVLFLLWLVRRAIARRPRAMGTHPLFVRAAGKLGAPRSAPRPRPRFRWTDVAPLLIVLALARPVWLFDAERTETVVVIDRSASMATRIAEGTRASEGLRVARERLGTIDRLSGIPALRAGSGPAGVTLRSVSRSDLAELVAVEAAKGARVMVITDGDPEALAARLPAGVGCIVWPTAGRNAGIVAAACSPDGRLLLRVLHPQGGSVPAIRCTGRETRIIALEPAGPGEARRVLSAEEVPVGGADGLALELVMADGSAWTDDNPLDDEVVLARPLTAPTLAAADRSDETRDALTAAILARGDVVPTARGSLAWIGLGDVDARWRFLGIDDLPARPAALGSVEGVVTMSGGGVLPASDPVRFASLYEVPEAWREAAVILRIGDRPLLLERRTSEGGSWLLLASLGDSTWPSTPGFPLAISTVVDRAGLDGTRWIVHPGDREIEVDVPPAWRHVLDDEGVVRALEAEELRHPIASLDLVTVEGIARGRLSVAVLDEEATRRSGAVAAAGSGAPFIREPEGDGAAERRVALAPWLAGLAALLLALAAVLARRAGRPISAA